MVSVPTAMKKRNILVVDDRPELTKLIGLELSQWGAQVTVANGGREALALLRFRQYDVVLLDLAMPRPDGWDILDHLKQHAPQMLSRTVILTGFADDVRARDILERDELPCVSKPFANGQLRAAVSNILLGDGPPLAA